MIDKIVQLYLHELPKCPVMLSEQEATEYFERLMMNGNIITYVKDGELLGFLEFWRCSEEVFGKVCLGLPISHDTDLVNGPVCMISRMYIVPDLRNAETFITIGREFLNRNLTATHYVALQAHKKHKPLQVYNRNEILKHYRIKE